MQQSTFLKAVETFAAEDKFISNQIEQALFDISNKLLSKNDVSETHDIFKWWYYCVRQNVHYGTTPAQTAKKYSKEDIIGQMQPLVDVVQAAEANKVQTVNQGLSFELADKNAATLPLAGLFLQNGQQLFITSLTESVKPIAVANTKEKIQADDYFYEIVGKSIASLSEPDHFDLLDLEDRLNEFFLSVGIEDFTESDVTDALEEFVHPQTLVNRIAAQSAAIADKEKSYLLYIFTKIQEELDIDPEKVAPPEAAEAKPQDAKESKTDALMAQMLEQFTDEKQKSFFADFLDFAKEQNALDKNNANQQQMMQQLGDIEKKWMRTPREKLGGLTPEEYKEQNPDVEKSTVQTYRRESPKVGRNDPCPCGSGKKYKKCHGK
jgi:hypothetical protein